MENVSNTKWNLNSFFGKMDEKSIIEERKRWKEKTDLFIKNWKGRTDYLEDPLVMKEALDDYEDWEKLFGAQSNELYYFWLKNQQDQNNGELKAKLNKAEEFSKKISNDVRFFNLNISKIPLSQQSKFLEETKLSEYGNFLKCLFKNEKYRLSEKEEKIMSLKSKSSYSLWVKMTSEFLSQEEKKVLDEDGKKCIKSFSDLLNLMDSQKEEVRTSSAKAFNEIMEKYSDIAQAELNAILHDKKVNDEIRGYDRPDKVRHVSDDVESEVIDTLCDAVGGKFDISRRYYALKAKLLGIPYLKYHERNIEYGVVKKNYSYTESINLVDKVFKKLDPKFSKLLNMFIEKGQIDVYPAKGKRHGAFCVHFLKTQPTYLFLNYAESLEDIKTIAHEMGHAINNELMKEKQNALNFDTPLVTAEVASTFMEDFVIQELMLNADDELKLTLLMQKLNGDVSSILRQIACYRFEKELHAQFREKGYLSKQEIGKLFQKNMADYMGDSVEQSPGSENWWIYWSHIRSYFYNYSYASGLLISKYLQRKVREDHSFLEKVKVFLSAGTSKSPQEIFLEMGLDITQKDFWIQGLNEIESLLDEAEALAKKLGKIK